MLTRLSLFAAALSAAGAAQAQTPADPADETPRAMTKAQFTAGMDARFAAIDSNKDGFLTRDEIAAVQASALQRATAAREQRMEAEFKKLDTNNNGALDLAEFKAAAPAVRPAGSPETMVTQLDSNKDGKVSPVEYRTPPLANFDKMDANKDGTITPQELQAARADR